MANKTRIVGLELHKLKESLTRKVITLQTQRFVEYAQSEITRLGNLMSSYPGGHHMDRTGNLLNSLCWGVTYKGAMKASGFYRTARINVNPRPYGKQHRGFGPSGGNSSYLHEFFKDSEEVQGRQLAEDFIKSYRGKGNGWTVFFAVLAPYWGYWEQGFTMKNSYRGSVDLGGGRSIPRFSRFMQFHVMTHVYDDVKRDLRPAETHITVHVPKYSYKNPKYKNRRGYIRIGRDRTPINS